MASGFSCFAVGRGLFFCVCNFSPTLTQRENHPTGQFAIFLSSSNALYGSHAKFFLLKNPWKNSFFFLVVIRWANRICLYYSKSIYKGGISEKSITYHSLSLLVYNSRYSCGHHCLRRTFWLLMFDWHSFSQCWAIAQTSLQVMSHDCLFLLNLLFMHLFLCFYWNLFFFLFGRNISKKS